MAKARKQKLKVFKTPIGFHDAYVAAPSRKAALEAWGAGTDLFTAGISKEVREDSEAAAEALSRPGEVVRAKRVGGEEEERPSPGSRRAQEAKPKAKPKRKPKPRPSRAAVDKTEKELARLEEKQAAEQAELDKEEVRLANRRRALEKKQREALEKAEGKRDEAERNYRRAMKEWAG